jgi:DNA (cytosine-5)-methyltransferase 1
VLNSKNFGVPQNRERVFIVGHIRGQPRPQVFPITKISTGNLKYCWGVVSDRKQWLKDGKSNSRNFSQGQRIYSAGGISQTLAGNAGGQGGKTGLYAIPTNTKLGYDLAEEKEDGIRLEHPNSKTARGRVIKGASQSLKTSAQVGVIDNMKIRRLTPTECERLQGFPDGFTEGVSDTQRYKTLGNAVTVNVVYEVARRLTLNTTLQTTDTTGFVSVRNK